MFGLYRINKSPRKFRFVFENVLNKYYFPFGLCNNIFYGIPDDFKNVNGLNVNTPNVHKRVAMNILKGGRFYFIFKYDLWEGARSFLSLKQILFEFSGEVAADTSFVDKNVETGALFHG